MPAIIIVSLLHLLVQMPQESSRCFFNWTSAIIGSEQGLIIEERSEPGRKMLVAIVAQASRAGRPTAGWCTVTVGVDACWPVRD